MSDPLPSLNTSPSQPSSAAAVGDREPGRRSGLVWVRPWCVASTFLVALANLMYWWAASSGGRGLGPVLPMSPVSAMAFLLLAAAFGAVLISRGARWSKHGLVVISTAAAAVDLAAALGGTVPGFPDWESVFDPAKLTFFSVPVGHSRFQTALLVAVTGFNLCAVLLASPLSRTWKMGALSAAGSALLGFLTLVADTAGNPMFSGAGLLGLTPPAALSFLLLNAGIALNGAVTRQFIVWLLRPESDADLRLPLREDRLALPFFGVLGCVAVIAVIYLRIQTRVQREQAAEALIADVSLKTAQVTKWRQDRQGDAAIAWSAPWYREITTALVTKGLTPQQDRELREVTAGFLQVYQYRRLTILDPEMRPVYWIPDEPDPAAEPLRMALKPGFAGRFVEIPVHPDRSGTLLWGYLVRIRQRYSEETGAYAVLQKDLRELFPYLQAWPKGNVTGQTLLWMSRGSQSFLLGGVRGTLKEPSTPLPSFAEVRNPDQAGTLGARIARGETGALEGPDAHGKWVLTAGRLIPDSNWTLTSSMSGWEVYAPFRRNSWIVLGFSSVTLGLVGFVTARFWRAQQRQLIQERLLADLARKRTAAQLGLIMHEARDIIILSDGDLRVIDANHQAIQAFGWTREELLTRHIQDLRIPEAPEVLQDIMRRAHSSEGAFFEAVYRRRDGSTFPAESSVRQVTIDGKLQSLAIIRDISERRRAEAELRVSEERYRLIAENTSDIISLVDLRTGFYTYVSPSIQNELGYRPEDMVGRPLGGFSAGDSQARGKIGQQVAAFNAGDASGRSRLHRVEALRKDGGVSHVEILATILPGADGRAETVLGVSRDVTERARAEAALRASEERYRLIAENTSDVIWLYDLAADGFSYISPSVLAQGGYHPAEFMGKPLSFTLGEEEVRRLSSALKQELAGTHAGERRSFSMELDQRHKDGSLVPTEVAVSVLRDASARPTHLLGITRVITERRRAQEALKKFNTELEQRVEERTGEIQALLGAIPDTVLLCDGNGAVLLARSPGYPGIAGLVTGKISDASRPAYDALLREIIRGMQPLVQADGKQVVQEYEAPAEAGKREWFEARAAPMPHGGMLVLLREISERKRHELGVQANLERERQLLEMKSQFVSVASHEFRTPLAAAVGTLELLERHAAKLTEAKRMELTARLQRSLSRLTEIMNGVLQLGRAESGRVQVTRTDADPARLAQDTIHEIESGSGRKHRFVFEPSGDPGMIPMDTRLTHHILSNLIGNAVRYSPEGTTVTVKLHIDGNAFTFTVADEGIGVPAEERGHIFEPFTRGSNVGQISGTGLGLNIVKRYTELMGGTIGVLPAERGTVFTVRIPLNQPAAT